MTNETVDDIERELREYGDRPPPMRAWIDLADRIDAAYKRDLQAMVDAGEIDMRTAMGEVERLRSENARLVEAMAFVVGCADSTCGGMAECEKCPVAKFVGGAE